MNKIKQFILKKKWNLYHDLAYAYFDRADKCPENSKSRNRYLQKYKKYMDKRMDIHEKLYNQ